MNSNGNVPWTDDGSPGLNLGQSAAEDETGRDRGREIGRDDWPRPK